MSDEIWQPPANTICVGGLVVKGEEILLVRQSAGHSLAGQWTIPWGFVDAGEWAHEAAIRETQEEAGITSALVGLFGVQQLRSPGWLALIYLLRYEAGEPTPDGVEVDAAAFFAPAMLATAAAPLNGLVDWLLRRYSTGQYQLLQPVHDDSYYGNRTGFF